jgi:hypothetical protein
MIQKPTGMPVRAPSPPIQSVAVVAAKPAAVPPPAPAIANLAPVAGKLTMLPKLASTVRRSPYAFVLVLGPPKVGKTTTCVGSAPGPVYVINCEREDDLVPAKEVTDDFLHNEVTSIREFDQAFAIAQQLIKEKRIKTVVLDTLSAFSETLSEECLRASIGSSGLPDGRKAWPEYLKRLSNVVARLYRLSLSCHVIVVSHFQDFTTTEDLDGQGKKIPKVGDGIVPLLYGRARQVIGAMFNNVVFLDSTKGERMFLTSIEGVWGIGCRYIKGVEKIPADIKVLLEHMKLGERV